MARLEIPKSLPNLPWGTLRPDRLDRVRYRFGGRRDRASAPSPRPARFAFRPAGGFRPSPGLSSVLLAVLFAGIAGAALMFLFDPGMGRRRRGLLRDRGGAAFRRTFRRLGRSARGAAAGAYGLTQKVIHRLPRAREPLDDVTLARKVESILFRDPELPKGRINLSADRGVVVLRGELDDAEEIRFVEDAVRRVPGVHRVESYLHLPGTPAPNKEPARRAS